MATNKASGKTTDERSYKMFVIAALFIAALTIILMVYDHFANKRPGELAYQAGNTYFNDQRYDKAKRSYLEALQENPDLAPAYGGLANTMVQVKEYAEALRFVNEAIELDPKFGGYYATRGIVHDRMGQYQAAISDYEKAVLLYPEVTEGMGWLDRFFYKLSDAPPTVAERLEYLKVQMKLPADQRVLRVPRLDDEQKPYEQ